MFATNLNAMGNFHMTTSRVKVMTQTLRVGGKVLCVTHLHAIGNNHVELKWFETGLSHPVKYFYWPFQGVASFVDHLCYFCLVFVMLSCMSVYWWLPCGHLLGKGWPLGSHLWCLIVKLSLFHWYPGSGVVLDCIDSWSLPFFLLCRRYGLDTKFERLMDGQKQIFSLQTSLWPVWTNKQMIVEAYFKSQTSADFNLLVMLFQCLLIS